MFFLSLLLRLLRLALHCPILCAEHERETVVEIQSKQHLS